MFGLHAAVPCIGTALLGWRLCRDDGVTHDDNGNDAKDNSEQDTEHRTPPYVSYWAKKTSMARRSTSAKGRPCWVARAVSRRN